MHLCEAQSSILDRHSPVDAWAEEIHRAGKAIDSHILHSSLPQQDTCPESAMLPFVVIFFLLGIALVIGGRKLEQRGNQAALWKVTDGQLLQREVVDVPSSRIEDPSMSRLKIEYSYVVRGIPYRSTRYALAVAIRSTMRNYRQSQRHLSAAPS
jgi:hypothetical protein